MNVQALGTTDVASLTIIVIVATVWWATVKVAYEWFRTT